MMGGGAEDANASVNPVMVLAFSKLSALPIWRNRSTFVNRTNSSPPPLIGTSTPCSSGVPGEWGGTGPIPQDAGGRSTDSERPRRPPPGAASDATTSS